MTSTITIVFFLLGLAIGSFLNVVIYRMNTHQPFGGRSKCLSCRHTLAWYDLVPLFSFLVLKGRCRYCKAKISFQYPIVELITGTIFGFLFWKFQFMFYINTLSFFLVYTFYSLMFSLLVVIAVYDLRHKIIPDTLVFIFGALSLLGMFFVNQYGFHAYWPGTMDLLSGPIIALPFAILWLVSKGNWMGLGDAKLALGLGWLVPFSVALSGLTISFWAGAVAGILMMFFSKKHSLKSEIPFAPFLVFGFFLAFIFGYNLFPYLFF